MTTCHKASLLLVFACAIGGALAVSDPCPGLPCFGCLNQKDPYGFNQPYCSFCLSNNTCVDLNFAPYIICQNADNSSAWASDTSSCGSLSASELRIIIIVGSIVGGTLAIGGCYYYYTTTKKEKELRKEMREERREERRKENVNAEVQAAMRRASMEHHQRKASEGGGPNGAEYKRDQNKPDPNAVHQAKWACTVCTFDNEGPSKVCKMCQKPRPADGGHKRTPSSQPQQRPHAPSQGGGAKQSVRPEAVNPSPEGVVFVAASPGEGEAVFVPV